MDKKKVTFIDPEYLANMRSKLALWYEENHRDLPWRNTTDPYKIWVSEIILQQTRVDQGMDYYFRFIQRFPNVRTLAKAEEEEVLKYWQGLGYYSRARNIHATAKIICEVHNGIFPTNYKEVILLKGIGPYTAAAICSFAYDQAYAVVDGNVFRFIARLLGIDTPIDSTKGKKEFDLIADALLDKQHPARHNQAMMEMGATCCLPASPKCTECPFMEQCIAHFEKRIEQLPVKEKRTQTSNRYFNYFYITTADTIYLHKRTDKDVWRNMYEFPLIETSEGVDETTLEQHPRFIEWFGKERKLSSPTMQLKHVLSHRIIYANFYEVELSEETISNYLAIATTEIEQYPVSRLIHRFLERKFQ